MKHYLIFFYTIKKANGVVYSGFNSEQERFNQILNDLGIVDEEKRKILRNLDRTKKITEDDKKELARRAKSINDAESLFSYREYEKKIRKRK